MPDLSPAMPEIVLLCMICVVLLADLFVKPEQRFITYWLTQLSLAVTAIWVVSSWTSEPVTTFNGSFIRDEMGDILKVAIFTMSIAVFAYSRDYLEQRGLNKGEYYILALLAILGMSVMVSSYNLLNIYLGLELLSLSLYALVAFNRDSGIASESAMKYYVLGAIASGMLLYGMSILYGLTGSLGIPEISQRISSALVVEGYRETALLFALVFVVVGVAFKLGAVPFHMWVPDVYHGAPTSVVLLISSVPKIAAFAMVMRLLVGGLESLSSHWQEMLMILAALSILIGNVVAIAQVNIKRMFAYSTISHVGFIMLGLLAATEAGYKAAMFYTLVYALTSLGGFGVILLLTRSRFESDNLSDFKGLSNSHPWIAFIMLILLASMIGIPGTAGFIAKLSVLEAVVNQGMVWLAVFAVVLSVVGAFYYLRVIWYMYFEQRPESLPEPASASPVAATILSINGLLVLLFGIFPGVLMALMIVTL